MKNKILLSIGLLFALSYCVSAQSVNKISATSNMKFELTETITLSKPIEINVSAISFKSKELMTTYFKGISDNLLTFEVTNDNTVVLSLYTNKMSAIQTVDQWNQYLQTKYLKFSENLQYFTN